MEFGVAAFSAVAGAVVSKICMLMEKKLKKEPEIRANVRFIKDDLEAIQAAIELHGPNREHIVLIAQLRRLAYDIEDCIDCFDANKTTRTDFANQIVDLKKRSIETTERIHRFRFPSEGDGKRTAQVQEAAVVVPIELQNLGDYNLNCLLYLCLFPRNHHVRTKRLVRRWLAEGLVVGEQDAVENMKILTNSSIFNSIRRSSNGEVRRCQPTDVLFRYICQQSTSENFILFCDGAQPSQRKSLQGQVARRLSVHPPATGQLNLPQDLSRLRTLAVFPAGAVSITSYEAVLDFTKYELLRVLDLEECAHMSEGHIQAIYKQKLMKYLSINLGSIPSITREIRHLDQLETLHLSGTETVTVFKEVLLLPRLKHLFGRVQLSKTDNTILGWRLKRFLRDKSVLETLAGFVTSGSPGFPQLMMRMRRLRKVKIWFKSDSSQKNLDAISLAVTKFIRDGTNEPDLNRSLSMDFRQCSGEFMNTIHSDANKKGRLDSLKLRGVLSKFPQFVAQLRAVEELCLWSTGLSWTDIRDGLSTVMGLKYLKLVEDNLGRVDILSDHLMSVERICVECKQSMELAIVAHPLPKLVSLHILCQNLHVIPGPPGIDITRMDQLKEVALHPQVDQTIIDKLQQAARGHRNTPVVSLVESAH
ncbi:disease resistance protein RGA4-like [Triticum dicoccoides]|uniref:disease resistance protein RGA4-like n=1 Tax=Triticum dicoccoides TaxID=85692 RepID=UPI0018906E85|nr:disease resistance protein RGA4-like [Triticum dicoccoides]